jgi:transposase
MRRIRELLRLKYENGLPGRVIAAALGLSKGAVNDYLQRATAAGLSWPLPEDLTDTALERRLFPGTPSAGAQARPEPNWAYVDSELRRKGVTRSLLWQEYRADQPEGFGYAWFCDRYDTWKGRVSATMRQTHGAGEKVFVDYAGDTIDVIDPASGVATAMKLFVAAMGASSLVYAEARPSEGLADWIGCHVSLFAFLGGVPGMIVCDNLKSGVTKPDRYEPAINRTYQEMARHYGTSVVPARPYKPRDKAKVEQSVLLVERWVMARLRNQRFFSLAALNRAIADLVGELNARIMRAYGASREALPRRPRLPRRGGGLLLLGSLPADRRGSRRAHRRADDRGFHKEIEGHDADPHVPCTFTSCYSARMARLARVIVPDARARDAARRSPGADCLRRWRPGRLSRPPCRTDQETRRGGLGVLSDAQSRPPDRRPLRRPRARTRGRGGSPALYQRLERPGPVERPSVPEPLRLGRDGRGPPDRRGALRSDEPGPGPPGRPSAGLALVERPRPPHRQGRWPCRHEAVTRSDRRFRQLPGH